MFSGRYTYRFLGEGKNAASLKQIRAAPLARLILEVVEEPTDVGEKKIADLGFLVDRRLDLGERVLQIPVLVGKGSERRTR